MKKNNQKIKEKTLVILRYKMIKTIKKLHYNVIFGMTLQKNELMVQKLSITHDMYGMVGVLRSANKGH